MNWMKAAAYYLPSWWLRLFNHIYLLIDHFNSVWWRVERVLALEKTKNKKWLNRRYYMAARRYEISLRVLNNISRVSAANKWNIFSTREEKRPCNVLFIIYYFACEDNMLFSLVKISRFRAKAHLVFHWCLYKKYVYSLSLFVFLKTDGCPILSTRLQSYSLAFHWKIRSLVVKSATKWRWSIEHE